VSEGTPVNPADLDFTAYCSNCGSALGAYDAYCGRCGTAVGASSAKRAATTPHSHFNARPDRQTDVMLAGWRARSFAYLLDFFVVMIPLTAICVGTGIALSRTVQRPGGTPVTGVSGWGALVIIIEVLVVSIGYFAIGNGRFGTTVGMRPFKIGVRDTDGHSLIGVWRAGSRFGLLWVALLVPIPGGGFALIAVDLLSPLWDERHQAWHDKMTRSIVVQN
jgi:uncharacterized RDD family membrane protein YckC